MASVPRPLSRLRPNRSSSREGAQAVAALTRQVDAAVSPRGTVSLLRIGIASVKRGIRAAAMAIPFRPRAGYGEIGWH
jgi:hypothetical protein